MNGQINFFNDPAWKKKNRNKLKATDFSEYVDKKTVFNGVPCFRGEFWTSKQRQAHRIHELSYRACFKPQLPAFFIERFSQPGDVVYDPFMGRGTTVVESALRNRIPYGNDINPLSRVLTEPRIHPPSLQHIYNRLSEIPWQKFKTIKHKEFLTFYHPKTLAQIEGLRTWFKTRHKKALLDPIDNWIKMVAVNRLTGHSPGFFSVWTMPPNQAVSLKQQQKINQKKGQKPPLRDVPALIAQKSKSLLSEEEWAKPSKYLLLTESSDNTPQISSGSVSLTVTSPPFLDTVDYKKDNWLRCWFLGIDLQSVAISQYKDLEQWSIFIERTLKELARVTCRGGYIAFEVGEVRAGKVQLEKYVLQAISSLPLRVIALFINEQKFTKTANCWGVSNNKRGTNTNRIVLLRKTG